MQMSEDLPATDKPDRYFYNVDKDGSLQKIDIMTGDIVSTSPRFEDSLIANRPLSPEFIKGNTKTWHYNEMYRDLVVQKIMEGKTITAIGKLDGFPSATILYRWRQEYEEFNDAIKFAKKARAEKYADRLAETVEETRELDKEDIAAEKLFMEKLKWLAEKDDPETYGPRIKHSGDADQPLTLIVDTGIPRGLEGSSAKIEPREDDIEITTEEE